jgi:hypothetical protein
MGRSRLFLHFVAALVPEEAELPPQTDSVNKL